jgi:hypothetical protein
MPAVQLSPRSVTHAEPRHRLYLQWQTGKEMTEIWLFHARKTKTNGIRSRYCEVLLISDLRKMLVYLSCGM